MNRYQGFIVKQRPQSTIEFVVFIADARQIICWSQADDIRLDSGNIQRELVQARWRQVSKFFEASDANVIPTSVTVAFSSDLTRVANEADLQEGTAAYFMSEPQDGLVHLIFPDCVRSNTFVIDGQHRLKGMAEVGNAVNVPVCLFPGLSALERAFQFVVINNKSHKVPTNNLKALIHNFGEIEENLRTRLAQASITAPRFATHVDILNESPDSPFHKAVAWVNNRHEDGKQIIQPTALENSLKEITRAFPDTKDDAADAILVLNGIWTVIFDHYAVTLQNMEEWKNLTKKATIQTISELIIHRLAKDLDPAFSHGSITHDNAVKARQAAQALIEDIPPEFWKEDWKMRSLDTAAGREIIAGAIRDLKRFLYKNTDPDADWRESNALFKEAESYEPDDA